MAAAGPGWTTANLQCIAFGGLRVDDAIEEALLRVVGPGAITAATDAAKQASRLRDQVRKVLGRDLEAGAPCRRPCLQTIRCRRDPTNRLVTGELEIRWNNTYHWRMRQRSKPKSPRMMRHNPSTTIDPAALCSLASVEILRTVSVRPDHRCAAEEAHRAHAHSGGRRRYRRCDGSDRAHCALDRRRP